MRKVEGYTVEQRWRSIRREVEGYTVEGRWRMYL